MRNFSPGSGDCYLVGNARFSPPFRTHTGSRHGVVVPFFFKRGPPASVNPLPFRTLPEPPHLGARFCGISLIVGAQPLKRRYLAFRGSFSLYTGNCERRQAAPSNLPSVLTSFFLRFGSMMNCLGADCLLSCGVCLPTIRAGGERRSAASSNVPSLGPWLSPIPGNSGISGFAGLSFSTSHYGRRLSISGCAALPVLLYVAAGRISGCLRRRRV